MSKTIFISYGHDENNTDDIKLIKKIKLDLEQSNFKVLMDINRLKIGDDWQYKLEKDILQSDWVLFFITPYSARRPDGYCLNELSYALYNNKSIAPIMIHFTEPPLSISRIQYLDFQNINNKIDYKSKIKEIVSVINGDNELGFEGFHTTLLNNIDPLKFTSVISRHTHKFIGRKWVYKEIDRWLKEDKSSRVLWITAEAGYGKSAIASYISEIHPSSIAIFFCQYDAMATRNPKNMLKTLIYELSTQLPEYQNKLLRINIKEKLKDSAADIFRELILEPLQNIKSPKKDLFFIIDALDEAQQENGKNLIVNLIANHFIFLPQWLSIIVTSRPEPELIRKLSKFKILELNTHQKENISDLKKIIAQGNNQKLESNTIEFLLKKSEGNILYLKNMLELINSNDYGLKFNEIKTLPIGMKEFYQQYFERKFSDSEYYEKNILPFINILVSSNEGLASTIIIYILNISERDYKKICSILGSLLKINHGIVSFYHKSLFDWLYDYNQSGDYSADICLGNKTLADNLWKLYNEGDKVLPIKKYAQILLTALYKVKANKKIQILLKDLSFISSILSLTKDGTSNLILDNDDIEEVFKNKSLKLIGVGESDNHNSGCKAIKDAIEFPLIDSMSIGKIKSVIVNFSMHPNYSIQNITEAMSLLEDMLGNAEIYVATATNESYSYKYIKVTIIATG